MDDEIYKKCVSTEEIYDILDGEASKELCAEFAEHIKNCERCRHEYESIAKMQAALKGLTSEPSADFVKNTLAKLKKTPRNPILRFTGTPAFKSITAAAACLVIVLVVCSNGLFTTADEISKGFDSTNHISGAEGNDGIQEDISVYSVSTANEKDSSDEYDAYDVSMNSPVNDVNTEDSEITDDVEPVPTEPQATEPDVLIPVDPYPEAPMAPTPAPVAPVAPMAPEIPQANSGTSDSGGDIYIEENSKSTDIEPAPAPAPTPAPKPTADPSSTDHSYYENLPEIPATICPEGPVPVEPPSVVVTPPTASDAFSADPKIPDYVYVPTPVVSDVNITEALYDHETLIVSMYNYVTDRNIYLTVWDGDSAVSQKTWIETAYCGEPKGEIVLPEDNTTEEDIIVVDPSEAIVPVVPTEPEPPSPERIIDGMYIIDDDLSDGMFALYWFADECYFRLVLPIEYKDGNETRFKELNLLPNPLKQ